MRPSELTPRQQEVAALVADGCTSKRIAGQLKISERRVNVHITSIAFLIGVDAEKDERVEIALWWSREKAKAAA